MSVTLTKTRSMRLAGLRRFAARPRLSAVGGNACVQTRNIGVGRLHRLAVGEDMAARDRGFVIGDAGVRGRRDTYIAINAFSADVRLGAEPG